MKKTDLAMQTRAVPIGTIDGPGRRVTVTWSTGARVFRQDIWTDRAYFEELSMDAAAIRLGRLQSGNAPVLASHWGEPIGVVEQAEVSAGEGVARLRFASTPDVADTWAKIEDRVIRNVSVGYLVHRYERSVLPGGEELLRATDWEPIEISIVAVGADAGAAIRRPDGFSTVEIIDAEPEPEPEPEPATVAVFPERNKRAVEILRRKARRPAA